jgi:hypothetical protein
MPRTKFVIYERLNRKAPTFSAVIDVGDKIYRFEAKLEAQQGRSSLVGTLTEVKSVKIWEGAQMLHVLPSGSLIREEAAEISEVESEGKDLGQRPLSPR